MNLSNRHLSHSGLPSRLDQLAGRHHVAPSSVSLEITESAAMLDPGHVRKVLLAIRDQGFSLALDDFGTGYSSLSHVKRLPIDTLKIDRAFVDGVTADRDDGRSWRPQWGSVRRSICRSLPRESRCRCKRAPCRRSAARSVRDFCTRPP